MSIILWIILLIFFGILMLVMTLAMGLMIHKIKMKMVKHKATEYLNKFTKNKESEKEVTEDELRTNKKYREFDKLRRLAAGKNKATGESSSNLSASGELQDSGVLRSGLNDSARSDAKAISIPD